MGRQQTPKSDPSVSRVKLEATQKPGDLPDLSPLPAPPPDYEAKGNNAPNSTTSGADQATMPRDAGFPSANQITTSNGDDTASQSSLSDFASEVVYEQEPYSFCKRFFRGYPTLVAWFPKYLGPPRKSTPDPPGPESHFGDEYPPDPITGLSVSSKNGSSNNGRSNGGETTSSGERSGGGGYESEEAPRRAPPSPWNSPPFPTSEYQGYPLIGVPTNPAVHPLLEALYRGPHGDWLQDSRIEVHGWVTAGGNWSNATKSNLPTAYWIVPNTLQLDQAVIRFEREVDSVQTDHIDWGFRSVSLYGIDYRYTTAGGWLSQQLLYHNNLYGYDPVELYGELYIPPQIFEGAEIRCGRWIACPDIEAQYSVDNYLASHSLLFTYDTYTQTGVMGSVQLNRHNMIQAAIEAGTDMAPWYAGALPTLFAGWRWVSQSNKDAFYTCLNNYNDAKFRYFMADGHKAGHDNFNYIVTTWEHAFSKRVHTKTEAYYMWQIDAGGGGTPSLAAPAYFGGGGGLGKYLPGLSPNYGVLNYTMFQLSHRDYFTVRNEWWADPRGERTGFATTYSSHTIGISHQFNDLMMIRPEIGYYHSYNVPAFNLGTTKNLLMYGFDFTIRF
jgi:Putative beta-barrel porin-2, OmpL-like. bbp2